MDIQHLVDRLEDLIGEGRRVPLSEMTLINEKRALAIIDQMRSSVPEEVDRASRLLAQRDQVLIKANDEATRIMDTAKENADKLVSRDAIVQQAQERAARIIEEARAEIEKTRQEADDYIADVLTQLETQLLKPLAQVRNGIAKINADKEVQRQRTGAVRQTGTLPQTVVQPPALLPVQTGTQPTLPAPEPAAKVELPSAPAIPKPISKPVPKDPITRESGTREPLSRDGMARDSKVRPVEPVDRPTPTVVSAPRRTAEFKSVERPESRVDQPIEVDTE